MKTLIAIITLISAVAFATEDQITQSHDIHVQDRVVAQIVGVSFDISSVLLTESGKVVVIQKNKKAESLKLVTSVKQEMMYAVNMLSIAELETVQREVVCMMIMPEYALQNLNVLDKESNSMRMVLSNKSCAIPVYVFPKEQYILEQAQTLKAQLILLAKQLVGN